MFWRSYVCFDFQYIEIQYIESQSWIRAHNTNIVLDDAPLMM